MTTERYVSEHIPRSSFKEQKFDDWVNKLKPDSTTLDYTSEQKHKHKSSRSMQELVEGCIAGDQRCQRSLFRQYRQSVFSLVYRLLGPGYDVDDIIQQVFIKVFKSLPGFKGLSSLDTWIYRITSKVCTDQLRKKYRKRQLDVVNGSDEMIDFVAAPSQYNPDSDIEQQELSKQVFDALEKLSVQKRSVVVMFEMEQMSLDQIADILDLPVGTVKSRLFHARRDLERHLKRYQECK